MHKFFRLIKDNWITDIDSDRNYGKDEILEVGKYTSVGNIITKRTMVQFNNSEISSYISSNSITDYSMSLEMAVALVDVYSDTFNIDVHPISQSWVEGWGIDDDDWVATSGSSWDWANSENNEAWIVSGSDYLEASASYNMFVDRNGYDFCPDIKSIYNSWESGSYNNYGLVIKLPSSLEDDDTNHGLVKFHSRHTNSIYDPLVRLSWDDSSYITGSTELITTQNIKPFIDNYYQRHSLDNDTITFRIITKLTKEVKSFSSTYLSPPIYRLDEDTQYSIQDIVTGLEIVPYSSYSKVSCDSGGNYITIDTSILKEWRTYRISIKTKINDVYYYYTIGEFNT